MGEQRIGTTLLDFISPEKELRNGYEVTSEQKALWNIQMNLAKNLLEVCASNNLKIWAAYGTLLGTVREHGYIPWDDDMDFMMFRDDYNKLISIAKEKFKPPFIFQYFGSEKDFYRGHAQLRIDGTTAILNSDIWKNFHQGVFIDIFVFDYLPEDIDGNFMHRINRAKSISDILECKLFHRSSKLSIRSKIGSTFYAIKRNKLVCEYNTIFNNTSRIRQDKIAPLSFLYSAPEEETLETSWFDETISLPFEGMELPVPAYFDQILRRNFGYDYMTPKQAPSTHGGYLVVDVNRNYIFYLKKIRRNRIIERMGVFSRMKRFHNI